VLASVNPRTGSTVYTSTEPSMSFWRDHRRGVRTILVLLILVAFVSLQSAAAAIEHPHNHGKDHPHCCAVCHVGHLGVIRAAAAITLAPPARAESGFRPLETCLAPDYLAIPSASRAPPA
jgi:hypothetical protein